MASWEPVEITVEWCMARRMPRLAWFMCTIALLVLLVMVGTYVVNPFGAASFDPRERIVGYGIHRVPSAAMAPAIGAGQVVFSDVGYYRGHVPRRGAVVVLRVPGNGMRVVKRVIGLPGETIAINNGSVEINGRTLSEPYVATENVRTPYSRDMQPFRVPGNAYFMLGDNRDGSEDSRTWGAVSRGDLQARVLGR
jgi:signal peptidase I